MKNYIIRDRESGNFIDEFKTLEEACDELTKYVLEDEANECDMSENDSSEIYDRRCNLMNFYEIYNREKEDTENIYLDINDNCVCFG